MSGEQISSDESKGPGSPAAKLDPTATLARKHIVAISFVVLVVFSTVVTALGVFGKSELTPLILDKLFGISNGVKITLSHDDDFIEEVASQIIRDGAFVKETEDALARDAKFVESLARAITEDPPFVNKLAELAEKIHSDRNFVDRFAKYLGQDDLFVRSVSEAVRRKINSDIDAGYSKTFIITGTTEQIMQAGLAGDLHLIFWAEKHQRVFANIRAYDVNLDDFSFDVHVDGQQWGKEKTTRNRTVSRNIPKQYLEHNQEGIAEIHNLNIKSAKISNPDGVLIVDVLVLVYK